MYHKRYEESEHEINEQGIECDRKIQRIRGFYQKFLLSGNRSGEMALSKPKTEAHLHTMYMYQLYRALSCKPATLAIKSFAKQTKNVVIHLKMDNTTALTYINKFRGTVCERHAGQTGCTPSTNIQCINRAMGPLQVDPFALRVETHTPATRQRELGKGSKVPNAMATDAFC